MRFFYNFLLVGAYFYVAVFGLLLLVSVVGVFMEDDNAAFYVMGVISAILTALFYWLVNWIKKKRNALPSKNKPTKVVDGWYARRAKENSSTAEYSRLAKSKKPSKPKKRITPSAYLLSDSLVVGEEYMLTYEDSEGDISNRAIIYRSSEYKNGIEYIKAVCLVRNSLRTFRADRVMSLFSAETGEVLV